MPRTWYWLEPQQSHWLCANVAWFPGHYHCCCPHSLNSWTNWKTVNYPSFSTPTYKHDFQYRMQQVYTVVHVKGREQIVEWCIAIIQLWFWRKRFSKLFITVEICVKFKTPTASQCYWFPSQVAFQNGSLSQILHSFLFHSLKVS